FAVPTPPYLGNLRRELAPLEALRELCGRLLAGLFSVKAGDDLRRERLLRRHRLLAGVAARATPRPQLDVSERHLVGDLHDLATHVRWRLVDAYGVSEGFGHFLADEPAVDEPRVGALEERRGERDLRLLSCRLLQLPPDEQIELLVGAAQLDVGA